MPGLAIDTVFVRPVYGSSRRMIGLSQNTWSECRIAAQAGDIEKARQRASDNRN